MAIEMTASAWMDDDFTELILKCVESCIQANVLHEIKEAIFFFPVFADENAGTSNAVQRTIVLHFVDNNENIIEEFMGFVICESGTDGETLFRRMHLSCCTSCIQGWYDVWKTYSTMNMATGTNTLLRMGGHCY